VHSTWSNHSLIL